MLTANNVNNVMELNRKNDWRQTFFDKDLCSGVITNTNDGNIEIEGKLKISNSNVKLLFWAAKSTKLQCWFYR